VSAEQYVRILTGGFLTNDFYHYFFRQAYGDLPVFRYPAGPYAHLVRTGCFPEPYPAFFRLDYSGIFPAVFVGFGMVQRIKPYFFNDNAVMYDEGSLLT